MILKATLQGMLDSQCYILGDKNEAVVIDPGAEVEDVSHVLDKEGLELKYIIMTHAHIDHIAQVDRLRSARGGKTVIHEADAPILGDHRLNGSVLFGTIRRFNNADIQVKDGDVLEFGDTRLEIIHTPGHTPGGICILVYSNSQEASIDIIGDSYPVDKSSESVKNDAGSSKGCIFTGDTLFRLGIGRTDLGLGDHRVIKDSLRRLMELDGTLKVYPGHGPATTIDYERQNNPWI